MLNELGCHQISFSVFVFLYIYVYVYMCVICIYISSLLYFLSVTSRVNVRIVYCYELYETVKNVFQKGLDLHVSYYLFVMDVGSH